MKVNRDQGATVEFCHPEGCSTARRIWLVLKALTQVLHFVQDDKGRSFLFFKKVFWKESNSGNFSPQL